MSKAARLLKIGALSAVTVLSAVALLIVWSIVFPPTYEAETELPGTPLRLVVQIKPMHSYLAEYHRYAELREHGERVGSVELFGDSGGYSRTQLYALPDGDFLVLGYFDAVRVVTSPPAIVEAAPSRPQHAKYLGAFERDLTGQWRFAGASTLPEKELVARGG